MARTVNTAGLRCLIIFIPCIIIVAGFSSCRRTGSAEEKKEAILEHFVVQDIERILVDVSLPLGISIKAWKPYDTHCFLKYSCRQSLQTLVDFYLFDFEQLGWHLLSKFVSNEDALLVFEKPHRICVIILSSLKQEEMVSIDLFVGDRAFVQH